MGPHGPKRGRTSWQRMGKMVKPLSSIQAQCYAIINTAHLTYSEVGNKREIKCLGGTELIILCFPANTDTNLVFGRWY